MDDGHKPVKHLSRSRTNRIIFGVCGGLGEYFGIDPLIFRIIFLALTFGAGSGILVYLIMALLVPIEPLAHHAIEPPVIDRNEFKRRIHELAEEFRNQHNFHSGRNVVGVVIVVLGVLLLLSNFFPISWYSWRLFWPLVLVVLGIAVLTRVKKD
jgi:phage shock protein C